MLSAASVRAILRDVALRQSAPVHTLTSREGWRLEKMCMLVARFDVQKDVCGGRLILWSLRACLLTAGVRGRGVDQYPRLSARDAASMASRI